MNRGEEHIEEIIGKFLSGEATPEEIALLDAWVQQSEVNKKYLDQFQFVFEKSSHVREWQSFDTDAAWSKVKANLKKKDAPVIPMHSNRWNPWILRIAASIIIVLGIGLFVYRNSQTSTDLPTHIEVVAEKKAVSDTLPGGSGVFLNKQTKLAYQYDKKKRTHRVKLKGEAYFNVIHTEEERFIVETQDVFIRDIGTSFNVKAYPESNTVEVVVESGEVILYTADNPGIHLRASGKGVYNKVTKQFTIDEPEANVLAYKTKFFVFTSTTLESVAQALNEVYDAKLIIPDHLKHCQLTVSFRNEDIQEIANVIAETLNLTVRQENGSFILEGQGCE